MTDANTRAHVASPTTALTIPVMDPRTPILQTSAISSTTTTTTECFPVFTLATPPQSHRQRREIKKKQKHDSAQPTPITTDTETSPTRTPPPIKTKYPNTHCVTVLPPQMKPTPSLLQAYHPLLICSIGNPGPLYASTLHSAGHILTSYLADRKRYQPFTKGLSGLVARPDTTQYNFSVVSGYTRIRKGVVVPPLDQDWTLWQSLSLMNVSGVGVKRAYSEWNRGRGRPEQEGRLVVVHDELEAELGKVTVRDGAASAKGHNGIKSCQQQLRGVKWWRVGVGIGRPESREPTVVSRYVLAKMSGAQRKALEDSAVRVFQALENITEGQR